jgi:archaellum component FlaF (FlaF/FlaG flagellin family)
VTRTNVYVDAGGPPEIDRIVPSGDPAAPITPNVALTIIGSGFGTKASDVQVLIDGKEIPTTSVTQTQIDLALPALSAGTHGLQVARPRFMGTPATRHQGLLSNLVPLVLRPVIDTSPGNEPRVFFVFTSPADPNDDPPPDPITGEVSGHLQVTVNPAVTNGQNVLLYLNERQTVPGPTARAYTVPVETSSITTPANTVVARFRRVVAGTYLIRIQVDGATSALSVNPDPNDPRFNGPLLEVTTP